MGKIKSIDTDCTRYEMACGAVRVSHIGAEKIEMYQEHNVFHVRRFCRFVDGRSVQEAWLVFDLQDFLGACKAFNRQKDIAKNIQSA